MSRIEDGISGALSDQPNATHQAQTLAQDPGELLAVVNERDEEIGAERRDEIHRRGLLHRAVHVIVTGPGGGILLQQRSALKDTYPLYWECVGGHLGPGETYSGAAAREVQEELGCPVYDLVRLGKHGPSAETGWEFIEVWQGRIAGPLDPPAAEILATEERPWPEWETEIQRSLCVGGSGPVTDPTVRAFAPGPIASFRLVGWLGSSSNPGDGE